jgi:hypothetical protein
MAKHLGERDGGETGGVIGQTVGNDQFAVVEQSAAGGSSALFVRCLGPAARGRVGAAATAVRKPLTEAFLSSFVRHFSLPGGCGSISRLPQPRLSRRNGQAGYPVEHPAKQPSPHMTLRQEQPIIAGMFHQPPAGLHQSLLQARSWSPVLFLSRSPRPGPEPRIWGVSTIAGGKGVYQAPPCRGPRKWHLPFVVKYSSRLPDCIHTHRNRIRGLDKKWGKQLYQASWRRKCMPR